MLLDKRCCFQIMQFHRLLSCQKHRNNLDIGCNSLANFTITTTLAATSSNQRFLHTRNNNYSTTTLFNKTTNATSNEENVIDGNEALLDKKFLTFDQLVNGAQNILLKLQQGRSGMTFFQISFQPIAKLSLNFPNISLPEAYLMVREMDELIGALPTTALKAPFTTNVENVNNNVPEFLPGGRQFYGKNYGYRLDMCWWRGKLKFCMRTIQTVKQHRGKQFLMPAQALPWLRNTMAQMLAQHDGTQQLYLIPAMPKWVFEQEQAANILTRNLNNKLEQLLVPPTQNADEQTKMRNLLRETVSQLKIEQRQQLLILATDE